jgi:hypothetical protein
MPVNVLTGRSGIGKSAFLIRPLKWLVFNKPQGEKFRRWGSKETRVDVWFDDDTGWISKIHVQNFQCHEDSTARLLPDPVRCTRVSRVRSNKDNYYEMQRGQDVAQIFNIAGDKRAPEPVSTYLNMSDINFQFQHDPIYLLGLNSTPLELARMMNRLAGMGDIDAAYSRANSMVREATTVVNVHAASIEKHQQEVEKYAGLDELESLVGVVNVYESEAIRLDNAARDISDAALSLDRAEDVCKQYAKLSELYYAVDRTTNNMLGLQQMLEDAYAISRLRPAVEEFNKYADVESLQNIVHDHEVSVARLVEAKYKLDMLAYLSYSLVDQGTRLRKLGGIADIQLELVKLDGVFSTHAEHTERFVQVYDLLREHDAEVAKHAELVSTITTLTDQYARLMPEICPICGKPTTQEDGKCQK